MSLPRIILFLSAIVVSASGVIAGSAAAQQREAPYWATLRYDEVRMRVGPSRDYPIEWVYKREGLPLKVVRLNESWRLVEDHEGTRGWIQRGQLSPTLGALVIGEGLADLRESPTPSSPLRWRAEPGVVGELIRCREAYCEIDVAGRTGWVAKERLWGAEELEPAS